MIDTFISIYLHPDGPAEPLMKDDAFLMAVVEPRDSKIIGLTMYL